MKNFAYFVAGVFVASGGSALVAWHNWPQPIVTVEMPVADERATKPDATTDVPIRFVPAAGWQVSHGPWGDGQFREPGFTAIITPPTTGYGELRCSALSAKGIAVGASYDNWADANGPIEKIPSFNLIGKPATIVCRLRSEP
jgi:hypothetical protein